jgi:hypothetical protein
MQRLELSGAVRHMYIYSVNYKNRKMYSTDWAQVEFLIESADNGT